MFDEVMCRAFGVHFFGIPCIGLDVVNVVNAVDAVFRHTRFEDIDSELFFQKSDLGLYNRVSL